MATTAQLGWGAQFLVSNGASPQVFTELYQNQGVSGFGFETALVEVSTLNSPGARREYILGMIDGKTFTVTVAADLANATHASLIADAQSRTARNMKLRFTQFTPDTTYNFNGLVTNVDGPNATPDAAVTITFSIKISGDVTTSVA